MISSSTCSVQYPYVLLVIGTHAAGYVQSTWTAVRSYQQAESQVRRWPTNAKRRGVVGKAMRRGHVQRRRDAATAAVGAGRCGQLYYLVAVAPSGMPPWNRGATGRQATAKDHPSAPPFGPEPCSS